MDLDEELRRRTGEVRAASRAQWERAERALAGAQAALDEAHTQSHRYWLGRYERAVRRHAVALRCLDETLSTLTDDGDEHL